MDKENKLKDFNNDQKIIMLIHYFTSDEKTIKSLLKEWYFDENKIKEIIKLLKD